MFSYWKKWLIQSLKSKIFRFFLHVGIDFYCNYTFKTWSTVINGEKNLWFAILNIVKKTLLVSHWDATNLRLVGDKERSAI